jgi:alkylation response protein AidB-like acyl-CoA dehydrogenase
MNFSFTDEQLLLRDTVRSLLERECPPSVARAALTDTNAHAPVWKRLEEIGVFDQSLTDLDLVLVFEEAGRAALPRPFVEDVVGDDFDRGALGCAAQLCGVSARMIEMTADYVKERHQFGVPVGSYQAIKHHLANALLQLEYARPAVYYAAYTGEARDVSFAKVYASRAGDTAARVSLQCHGAIGYSFEYDLHLFMKRAWALARQWGTEDFHRNRVADAVIGADRG